MHNLKFKNKRGKVILTLQWNKPTDLIDWANAMADVHGYEQRNVVPEVPVTLKAHEGETVHKLKVVSRGTDAKNELDVNELDVKVALLSVIDNLNEEFELILSRTDIKNRALDDKKNQIAMLNSVIDGIEMRDQLRKKLEGCLLIHGVPGFEIKAYLNRSLHSIEKQVEWAYREVPKIKERIFKIPLGFSSEEREPTIVDRPIIGIEKLKKYGNA